MKTHHRKEKIIEMGVWLRIQTWPFSATTETSLSIGLLLTESFEISTESKGSKSNMKHSSISSMRLISVFLLTQNTGLNGVPLSSSSSEYLSDEEGDISINCVPFFAIFLIFCLVTEKMIPVIWVMPLSSAIKTVSRATRISKIFRFGIRRVNRWISPTNQTQYG